MGPLHDALKHHCRLLVENVELVVSSSASFSTASFDNLPWENQEAFYAVQNLHQRGEAPHLAEAFKAFLRGALDGWDNFTTEFLPGGYIAEAAPELKKKVFMNATNDCNEGALGSYRVSARHAPNMTVLQHNARKLYRRNHTGSWIRAHMRPADRRYTMKLARKIASSGRARRDRLRQAEYDVEIARKKKANIEKIRVRKEQKQTELASIKLATLEEVSKLRVDQLKKQLTWYREIAKDSAIAKSIPGIRKLTHKKPSAMLYSASKRKVRPLIILKVVMMRKWMIGRTWTINSSILAHFLYLN